MNPKPEQHFRLYKKKNLVKILLCDKSDCFTQLVSIAVSGEAARGEGGKAAARPPNNGSRPERLCD